MPPVTLEEFLSYCEECVANRTPAAGLAACERVLADGAHGRLLVAALRYKAGFYVTANDGWGLLAVGYLLEALQATEDCSGDRAAVLHALVVAYSRLGVTDFAQQYADQYFEMAGRTPDLAVQRWAPKVWFALGYAYDAVEENAKAAECYRQAREIALALPGSFSAAIAANNLVQMYLADGRVDEAHLLLKESQAELDTDLYGGHSKDQEAQCLLAMKRTAEAEALCNEALTHSSSTDDVRVEAAFTLSRIRLEQGHIQEAKELATGALDLAMRLPNGRLMRKIEGLLMTLHTGEEVPEE